MVANEVPSAELAITSLISNKNEWNKVFYYIKIDTLY